MGDLPSLAVDFSDIFSSCDATLALLQKTGIVPGTYHMPKAWHDHVLAFAGFAGGFVGVDSVIKSARIAALIDRVRQFPNIFKTIANQLDGSGALYTLISEFLDL